MVFRMIHVKDSLLPRDKVWSLDFLGIYTNYLLTGMILQVDPPKMKRMSTLKNDQFEREMNESSKHQRFRKKFIGCGPGTYIYIKVFGPYPRNLRSEAFLKIYQTGVAGF